jgi:Zn-dependent protease
MDDTLVLGIIWYIVFVTSTTFHEAAHAFVACKLGDWTAFHGGQVTLNPIPHIQREPIGMLIIPWISYAANGWMMGWASAPYDPQWAQAYPRRAAWMSLSGPGSNLLLTVIAGVVIHLGIILGYFHPPDSIVFTRVAEANADGLVKAAAVIVSIFFSLNLVLFVFNMIPIAPLDGQAWMELLLKGNALMAYRMTMMHPSLRLFGLFIAWMIMDFIYNPIFTLALNVLYMPLGLGYG